MREKKFIEEVFEIAFGEDAINRNFEYEEVLEELKKFSDDSLKWEIVNDYDKEFYEGEFYGKPAKEGLTE